MDEDLSFEGILRGEYGQQLITQALTRCPGRAVCIFGLRLLTMYRISHSVLLVVAAIIAGCKAPIDTSKDQVPKWAIGGTLNDMLLPNWAKGTPEDKLATAGNLLYDAFWRGHLQTGEQIAAFHGQSVKLVRMMDDMSRLYPRMVQVNPAVAGWTARSFIQECLRDGEEFDRMMGPVSLENKSSVEQGAPGALL